MSASPEKPKINPRIPAAIHLGRAIKRLDLEGSEEVQQWFIPRSKLLDNQ